MSFVCRSADSLQPALDSVANYIAHIFPLDDCSFQWVASIVLLGLFSIAEILLNLSDIQVERRIKTLNSRIFFRVRAFQRDLIPMQNLSGCLLLSCNVLSCDLASLLSLLCSHAARERHERLISSSFRLHFYPSRT
jgi:hypothetical protein